jgi:hypothetical protein
LFAKLKDTSIDKRSNDDEVTEHIAMKQLLVIPNTKFVLAAMIA